MGNSNLITTLFLDIGDVLLTNGWGHESRIAAAKAFNLDYEEMQSRHKLVMATYEEGKITLSDYLNRSNILPRDVLSLLKFFGNLCLLKPHPTKR